MARIFISHSSHDNAQALAISHWLKEQGWGEPYLDISPSQGLAPGEQWRAALTKAAARCEAVLCLLSPAWLNSGECRGEFAFACYLKHKAIIGLVIDPHVDMSAVPAEMRSWQICNLTRGDTYRRIQVSHDPLVPPTEVSFAEAGLALLDRGLKASSLSPTDFPYDATRPPYRGLKPLEAEDAAIFFGREAAIVHGIETIRRMREHSADQLMVILGASGSGKSSFLRAGLWPRLRRDDQHFLPLPIIRAGRAAISGKTGLLACVATAFEDLRQPRSRSEILQTLNQHDGNGLPRLLADLQFHAASGLPDQTILPTLVLSIDQAEELYGPETRAEAGHPTAEAEEALALRRHLRQLLIPSNLSNGPAQAGSPRPLVLAAIRSDSYERLQSEPHMAEIGHIPFNLPPLTRGEYSQVVTGPAEVATKQGSPLTIEPALTEALLHDAEGADALPLLAFILERLYLEGGAQGELRLHHYHNLGGLKGSIIAAIKAALAEPERSPAIPAQPTEQERLLRKAFIGHLVTIDEDTGVAKRRMAQWQELLPEAHPLLQRLIEARLLLTDTRMILDNGEPQAVTVVEIAHEALIRQWEQLGQWIEEDKGFLIWQRRLHRAMQFWEAEQQAQGALLTEFQLEEATRRLAERPESLKADERRFIHTSIEYQRQLNKARWVKRAKTVTAFALTGIMVALWVDNIIHDKLRFQARQEQVDTILSSTRVLTHNQEDPGTGALLLAQLTQTSGLDDLKREPAAAVLAAQRLLTQPIPTAIFRPQADRATRATNAQFSQDGQRLLVSNSDGTVTAWPAQGQGAKQTLGTQQSHTSASSFSPDGRWVATWVAEKESQEFGVRVHSTDEETSARELTGHQGAITSATFSPDNGRLLTTSEDGTARLWTVTGSTSPIVLENRTGGIATGGITCGVFSADGRLVATGSHDGTARLWRAADGTLEQTFGMPYNGDEQAGHTRGITSIAFSQDATGRFLVTTSHDKTARVWHSDGQQEPLILKGHADSVLEARFSPDDSTKVVTASQDYTARLWTVDWPARRSSFKPLQGHTGPVTLAAFTHDGRRVLTASEDDTVRLWDPDLPTRALVLRGHTDVITTAGLTPDDQEIVTTSADGTARIWHVHGNDEPKILRKHGDKVTSVAYAPRAAVEGGGSPDFFTGSDDGTIVRWRGDAQWEPVLLGKHPASQTSPSWVRSVEVSRDGTLLVTASQDRTARIWRLASSSTVTATQEPQPLTVLHHDMPVTSASFSPDGRQILTTTELAPTAGCIGEPPPPSCVANADTRSATVHLWSIKADGTIDAQRTSLATHTKTVLKGAYASDGSRFVTASLDGTALVWQATPPYRSIVLRHGNGSEVIDAAFAPQDATLVVTASTDGVARLWRVDQEKARLIHATSRHDNFVTSAVFSPSGSFLVTTSDDWTARVWKIVSRSKKRNSELALGPPVILRGHEDVVRRAAVSPDGKYLVTGSHDRTARLWRIDWDELQQYFKQRTRGCLTARQREEYLKETREEAQRAVATCEQTLYAQGPEPALPARVRTARDETDRHAPISNGPQEKSTATGS